MQGKLPELENLLVSRSGMTASNYKTATFAAIGVYLIGGTLWKYYSLGIADKVLPNLILGFASFFVLKYQKLVYVSPVGMVKETHTWITHHREVLRNTRTTRNSDRNPVEDGNCELREWHEFRTGHSGV